MRTSSVRIGHSLRFGSWSLVPVETRDKYVSGAKSDSAPVIDLLSHGYAKLLGKGKDQIRYGGLSAGGINS